MSEVQIPDPLQWNDVRTFFLPSDQWREPYCLDAEESRHLSKVLRIRKGEDIRILDGCGREGWFRVAEIGKKGVRLELIQSWMHPEPQSGVILAAAWTKAARHSWILEKAVELEAKAIWFWQAERSQFPVPDQVKETWRAQLVAGSKQCRNPYLPEIRVFPGGVQDVIRAVDALPDDPQRILPVESGFSFVSGVTDDHLAKDRPTVCVIGPEGGYAPHEVDNLLQAGFQPVTLGRRVLRWETAAVLCLGLFWWKRELRQIPERS